MGGAGAGARDRRSHAVPQRPRDGPDDFGTGAALAPDTQQVGTGTTTTTYDYDSIKELISSTSTYRGHATYGYQTSSTFGYDAVGNMVSKSQTDAKLTYANAAATTPSSTTTLPTTTYGLAFNYTGGRPHAANTISETTSTSTVVTHNVTHDGSGNNLGETAGANTRVLTWDEADRLKQVTVNGATKSTFKYNPDGERTQRLSAGNATNFYFNQFLVIEGTQYVTKNIFAGTDRLVSKTEATALATPLRHFYHGDQLGSTSYITDASKTLVQHERYFPFGERWAEPGYEERAPTNGASGPIYPRNWLFTDKELDTDTGYYYYGARYYDARNARWLSPDPILASYMQGSPNGGVFFARNLGLYSYSANNPVVLKDVDGQTFGEATAAGCLFGPEGCAGGFIVDLAMAAFVGASAGAVVSQMQSNNPPPPKFENVPPPLPAAGAPPSEANAPGPISLPGSPISEDFSTPPPEIYSANAPQGPTVFQSAAKAPSVGGETEATKNGREAHKNYGTALGGDYRTSGIRLPSGKIPDAIHNTKPEVRELKPNNKRAIARGQKQVDEYARELERIDPLRRKWTGVVDTYQPRKSR